MSTQSVLSAASMPLVPRLDTMALMTGPSEANAAFAELVNDRISSNELEGKRIGVLVTDGVEEVELTVPVNYLRDRGATVEVISPPRPQLDPALGVIYPAVRENHILTIRFMDNAGWYPIDVFLNDAKAENYDGLYMPGGAWNPDAMRMDESALEFVRAFSKLDRPLAAICHAPQVLISAGILKGRKATGYWSIQVDIGNAGAQVSDEPLVVDGRLITSRFPFDLPQLLPEFQRQLHASA